MSLFLKDPGASLDWTVDWAAGYLDGQTIADSQWSAHPEESGGIAIAATALQPTRTAVTLAGGVPGHVYRISNRVTLSDGRLDERALTVRVEER